MPILNEQIFNETLTLTLLSFKELVTTSFGSENDKKNLQKKKYLRYLKSAIEIASELQIDIEDETNYKLTKTKIDCLIILNVEGHFDEYF